MNNTAEYITINKDDYNLRFTRIVIAYSSNKHMFQLLPN